MVKQFPLAICFNLINWQSLILSGLTPVLWEEIIFHIKSSNSQESIPPGYKRNSHLLWPVLSFAFLFNIQFVCTLNFHHSATKVIKILFLCICIYITYGHKLILERQKHWLKVSSNKFVFNSESWLYHQLSSSPINDINTQLLS